MAHQEQQAELLPLILQHPSVTQQQQVLCRLLCASKSVRATISQLLRGQVAVSCASHQLRYGQAEVSCDARAYCAHKAAYLPPWLAQHGHLIKSLDLRMVDGACDGACERGMDDKTEAALAAVLCGPVALMKAAGTAAPQGLRLQSFKSDTCSSTILQQLPRRWLTNLQLNVCQAEVGPAAAAEALAQLSALRSLDIQVSFADAAADMDDVILNALLPALPALRALTGLTLVQLGFEDNLQQYLPPQLLELRIGLNEDWFSNLQYPDQDGVDLHGIDLYDYNSDSESDDEEPAAPNVYPSMKGAVRLGHLTSLTKLDWCIPSLRIDVTPPVVVSRGDVLPRTLKVLTITNCTSVQPLLWLQQLERLDIHCCATSPQELLLLRQLTRLREVRLSHWQHSATAQAAAAWSALPLKYLAVCVRNGMDSSIMQHLSKVETLTQLSYSCRKAPHQQQLCTLAQQLTGLCALKLGGWGGEGADGGSVGYEPLIAAIVGLAQLRELLLYDMPLGRPAVSQLAAAVQLTSLGLCYCYGVDDDTVEGLARSLTGLKQLAICKAYHARMDVTDRVLPVIADHLQQLTSLDVASTGVSDAGVVHLSRLAQLKRLGVGYHVSRAAKQQALRCKPWQC